MWHNPHQYQFRVANAQDGWELFDGVGIPSNTRTAGASSLEVTELTGLISPPKTPASVQLQKSERGGPKRDPGTSCGVMRVVPTSGFHSPLSNLAMAARVVYLVSLSEAHSPSSLGYFGAARECERHVVNARRRNSLASSWLLKDSKQDEPVKENAANLCRYAILFAITFLPIIHVLESSPLSAQPSQRQQTQGWPSCKMLLLFNETKRLRGQRFGYSFEVLPNCSFYQAL